MFEGMGVLVACEHDAGVLEQLHTNHVAESVVLFVDGVYGGVWHLWQVFIHCMDIICVDFHYTGKE